MSGTFRREFLTALVAGVATGAQAPVAPPKSPELKPPGAAPQDRKPAIEELPRAEIVPADKATGFFSQRRGRIQYLFDVDEAEVKINDLRFGSAKWGLAACASKRKESDNHFVLITQDGGASWTESRIKDQPLSLATLDDGRAFLVTSRNLWYSSDGGFHWDKRKLPGGGMPMIRTYFVDEMHGWIWGFGKIFYTTADGGRTWQKVPETEKLQLNENNTSWSWMQFISKDAVMIVGNSISRRLDSSSYPDWMLPEQAAGRRITPSTTVVAESRNAGKTWQTSVASTFGRIVRLRTIGIKGIGIFHYGDGIEWPSEVYLLDLGKGTSEPLFRKKGLVIWDAAPLSRGGVLLAGIEQPGRMRTSPVPGKLRLIWSQDGKSWEDVRTDYRAIGGRATFARVDDDNIWVAADEGAILKLVGG